MQEEDGGKVHPVEDRKKVHQVRSELRPWSASKQKRKTSTTDGSPTQSPKVIWPSAYRGSTLVTWLFPSSSNENNNLPSSLQEDDSSLALLPWWHFFSPLLHQTSTKQIYFSPLKSRISARNRLGSRGVSVHQRAYARQPG